jgi:kinesin family protein 3/17
VAHSGGHPQLNLIDLAGSEKQSKTGATPEQLQEATSINQSLMTLGSCISALSSKTGGLAPFRTSPLTYLMQVRPAAMRRQRARH